ncbi:MAG: tetratricopeptide repeat protein [Candidatus Binatia bacterium]
MKHLKRFAGAAVSLTSFLFARHSFADFAPAEQLSAREEAVLGIDTESLTRMESTADGYKRRGLYSHAETIIQEVFDIRQKKKGADDPEMAYYHNNLGWLKAEQGKYTEAEQHYLRAGAITETTWGANHPDLADQLNNLAGVYRSQARFAEAESLYQRAIKIWENYSAQTNRTWPSC